MSKGAPDYSNVRGYGPLYRLDDMAELAARLGSIVTFDRRGDVVWLDDFNHGIKAWRKIRAGTATTFELSTLFARSTPFSAKLWNEAADTGSAGMQRYFPYPVIGKIGFEISFTVDANATIVQMIFIGLDGETYFEAAIRYYPDDDVIKCQTGETTWTPLPASVHLKEFDYFFHTAKLVIDIATGKYVRFILDDAEYDLSAYDFYAKTFEDTPYMTVRFQVYKKSGATHDTYVDDAILTQNEP